MMLISYDISDDKLRTQFSKHLKKYGYRIQYSVFAIRNSERVLRLIQAEIETRFAKRFSDADSIMIYEVNEDKIISYGYATHEDDDIIVVT
ncbi:MAG: CRISPR-associated endonuclease Cas2 [Saccharofermentanales bacterium]|jgi:CRISPR-associated protein Cas2|nr:CRISPR-associated endonuclease Cas2 [Petrimonas sp.]